MNIWGDKHGRGLKLCTFCKNFYSSVDLKGFPNLSHSLW